MQPEGALIKYNPNLETQLESILSLTSSKDSACMLAVKDGLHEQGLFLIEKKSQIIPEAIIMK